MSDAAPSWRVACVPSLYGHVDDGQLCRHVRVATDTTLLQLKCAILAGFEDQYQPSQIRLFTRKHLDDPVAVSTDRQAALLLSYEPDWIDQQRGDTGPPGTVLLVASAMNEEENHILVLPAVFTPPQDQLLSHLRPSTTNAALSSALSQIEQLATPAAAVELFEALPLPGHVDDWLAQYREATQSVSDLLSSDPPRPSKGSSTLCIQPLLLPESGPETINTTELFEGLLAFMQAFFHGTPCKLLPPMNITLDQRKKRVSVLGRSVRWRDRCPVNGEFFPHGQLCAPELLDALTPKKTRAKKAYNCGVQPDDGFCVLGVTLTDLFCGDDDVFTGGLASLSSRAGLFSFHRYVDAQQDQAVVLARACKTAVHEVIHMMGIGHCVHKSCLMNGCGHLREDFNAPPQLCPVDLAKLITALGMSCELVPRYQALLRFCEGRAGFLEYATWLEKALTVVDGASSGSAAEGLRCDQPTTKRRRR